MWNLPVFFGSFHLKQTVAADGLRKLRLDVAVGGWLERSEGMASKNNDLLEITDGLERKLLADDKLSWEDIQYALSQITPEKDRGLYGLVCCYAAFYMLHNGRQEECLVYLNDSIRCIPETSQERELAGCYNLLGEVFHGRNNLVAAMEHYEKALIYAKKYHKSFVYSLTLGNMADAYHRVGSYQCAVDCYKECLGEIRKDGRNTPKEKKEYCKILANYGYCLTMSGKLEEASAAAKELELLAGEHVFNAAGDLAAYEFLAVLHYCRNEMAEADRYMELALHSAMSQNSISSASDHILNLIHYLIMVERFDSLQNLLDYLEPQAAVERNEGLLLQLLLYRLQYCSSEMDRKSFLDNTNTFFQIKNKHEYEENTQILRMMSLHNRLRKTEEEQSTLRKKNSALLYQAEHDALSGLYNKRFLNRRMEEIFEEAMRRELPLGVLFLDIDYFKQMNDRYGHQMGDRCIVAIADSIKACMSSDFAARYGGDEFVIITIGKSRSYLEDRSQMLAESIMERRIPNADSEYVKIVTVTIGAVYAVPHKPNKMWDFMSAADEALYQQKKEHRGRVRFSVRPGEYL